MSIMERKSQLEDRKRKQESHTNQSIEVDESNIIRRELSNHQKIAKEKKDCSDLPILFFFLFVSPLTVQAPNLLI